MRKLNLFLDIVADKMTVSRLQDLLLFLCPDPDAGVATGTRLVCRPGVWIWGRGSKVYPKWVVHVCRWQVALHVQGSLKPAAGDDDDAMQDEAAKIAVQAAEVGDDDVEQEDECTLRRAEDTLKRVEDVTLQRNEDVCKPALGERVSAGCLAQDTFGIANGGEGHFEVGSGGAPLPPCSCQWCRRPWKLKEGEKEEEGEDEEGPWETEEEDEDSMVGGGGEEEAATAEGEEEAAVEEEEAAAAQRELEEEEARAREEGKENTRWIGGGWRGGAIGKDKDRQGCEGWGMDRWAGLESEIQGQWCVSNASYGSLAALRLRYHTYGQHAIFDVSSGPWILQGCDVRGNNVVCVEVSSEGMLFAQDCVFGGTGPRLGRLPGRRGVAHVGVNALMNANVTLRRCVLQDIGLADGMGLHAAQSSSVSVEACVLRRCCIAIYMAHFAHVRVRGCLIDGHKHSALLSDCYQENPAAKLPSWNATGLPPSLIRNPLPLCPLSPCRLPLMTPSSMSLTLCHTFCQTHSQNTLYTLTHTYIRVCAHRLDVPPHLPSFSLSLALSLSRALSIRVQRLRAAQLAP